MPRSQYAGSELNSMLRLSKLWGPSPLKEFKNGRKDPFYYEAKLYGKKIFVTLSPILKNGEFIGCVQIVRPKNTASEK